MIRTYTYRNITWLDLTAPTRNETNEIASRFSIHPSVARELVVPSPRSKVELYDSFIYLVLHFPIFRHAHRGRTTKEVDFIIGKDFIVTTHYDPIDPLETFSKVLETNEVLDRPDMGDHAGVLFFHMMREIYRTLTHRLDTIENSLREVEQNIFKGKEREMVFSISQLSRDLIEFRQAMTHQESVLESLQVAGEKFFGTPFAVQVRALQVDYRKVFHSINMNIDLARDLRETNDSLLSTKQNEIMKTLTIIAFIALPLTVVTALFQVDTVARPIVGNPNDFWILLGIQLLIVLALFTFFKRKKWL